MIEEIQKTEKIENSIKHESTDQWIDCGSYLLNVCAQGTPCWHKLRTGRLTASNFGTAAGYSNFMTPDELADTIAGLKKKEYSEKSREVMDFGTKQEPMAREWYAKSRNVIVEELGLAVWKQDQRLACSIDGQVGSDGMIEIKSPKVFYKPLLTYEAKIKSGWIPDDPFYHDHIWPTQYAQLQGCMAIMDKKWTDYICWCQPENRVFTQRLKFNEKYWKEDLYPKLQTFLNEKLEPRMKIAKK